MKVKSSIICIVCLVSIISGVIGAGVAIYFIKNDMQLSKTNEVSNSDKKVVQEIQETQEMQKVNEQSIVTVGEQPVVSEEDFSIISDNGTIHLNMMVKEMDAILGEEYTSELVTSFLVGEEDCKIYRRSYDGIEILSSNEFTKDNNQYQVIQIDVLSSKLQTKKGLKVGDKLEKAEALYGQGEKDLESNLLIYQYQDMRLDIQYDNSDNIIRISMYMIRKQLDEGMKIEDSENKEVIDEVEGENKTVYSNEQLGISIPIPEVWEGKYVVESDEGYSKFTHIYNGQKGDLLFLVERFGTVSEWENEGDYPWVYVGEKNGLVYVTRFPSECTYDTETKEGKRALDEYLEMLDAMGGSKGIIERIHLGD